MFKLSSRGGALAGSTAIPSLRLRFAHRLLQLLVLSIFPSRASARYRRAYRAVVCAGSLAPMAIASCTTILPGRTRASTSFAGGVLPYPSLVWGGVLPSLPMLAAGVGLGAFGCVLFLRPHAVRAFLSSV